MSPLAKDIIEKLNNEQDTRVLAEVLDFYEYLKQKNDKQLVIIVIDVGNKLKMH